MITRKTLCHALHGLPLALVAGVLAALFCIGSCRADDLYNWSPVRIGAGGFVTGFVTHPLDSTVRYCRTDVGNAYRWDNTAGRWVPMVVHNQAAPVGLPSAPAPGVSGVESLALDPHNTQVVYMAFKNGYSSDVSSEYAAVKGSVFKSTDGGKTFAASDLNVDESPNSNWRAEGERIAVDPGNASIVYYGTNDNGLWRSTNGGIHWSQVSSGGAPDGSKPVLGVRFDPVTEAIYAVVLAGGVFRSGDGGATWTDAAAGTGLEGHGAFSIISPDGSLWVVQNNSDVVWHDSAGTWTSTTVDFGWGQQVSGVAVDPKNANRLWAIGWGGALSRTDNGGQLWNPCDHQLLFANTLGWLPQNPLGYRANGGIFYDSQGVLWVPQGNEGVLTYTPTNTETNTDAGAPHWTIQSQGIEEFVTHDVIMPPGGKTVVAVEDATGFVVSDPTQFTAAQIPLQSQLISNGTGVAYCPNDSSSLAVATADVNGTSSGLSYSGYSLDGGASWHPFASYPSDSSGATLRQAGSIAVSRRSGWGDGGDHLVWVPTGSNPAYWSHDGGQSWHASTGFPTGSGYWTFALKQRALKADPFVADKFYYLASWSGGCYVSTDGGQTWAKTSGATLPTDTHHGQLEINRAVPNDLWYVDGWEGATAHGLWHSTDGGTTFVKSSAFDHALTLAVGKGSGSTGDLAYSVYVYGRLAGDADWGVFRSNDGGTSWVRVSYYPCGIFDQPTCLAASWDTYGSVILGFGGNSFVYGKVSGSGGGGSTGLDPLLTGKEFDDGAGSWANQGSVAANALDGNLSTFYDCANATGGFVGIDLGVGKLARATTIRYVPRIGFGYRMVGGVFQGSNDFSSWTTLATISSAPTDGQWVTAPVSSTSGWRYLRYLGPSSGYCNVAEIEFHGTFTGSSGSPTSGSLSGSAAGTTSAISENLTADWAHWGYSGTGMDHKAAGGAAVGDISGLSLIGSSTAASYGDNLAGFSWTDGTPDSAVSATPTGVYVGGGTGSGPRFSVPVGTAAKTIKIWVAGWDSDGTLTAHLYDSSAADFTDSSLGFDWAGNTDGNHYYGIYTLTCAAASPGQTRSVSWVQSGGPSYGNLAVAAVTEAPAPPPQLSRASKAKAVSAKPKRRLP